MPHILDVFHYAEYVLLSTTRTTTNHRALTRVMMHFLAGLDKDENESGSNRAGKRGRDSDA